jgi:hypothetical protein
MKKLGVNAALVDGEVVPGYVEIDGDVVAAIGVAPAGHHGIAVPGYIDLQVTASAVSTSCLPMSRATSAPERHRCQPA